MIEQVIYTRENAVAWRSSDERLFVDRVYDGATVAGIGKLRELFGKRVSLTIDGQRIAAYRQWRYGRDNAPYLLGYMMQETITDRTYAFRPNL